MHWGLLKIINITKHTEEISWIADPVDGISKNNTLFSSLYNS